MSDQQSPFQSSLETIEGRSDLTVIPAPVNPLQAQTAFEKRASREDWVAHIIAIIMTGGFFLLAFAALLGFVKITDAATATFLGTTMGYAVGQFRPILERYFHPRTHHPVAPQRVAPANGTSEEDQAIQGTSR